MKKSDLASHVATEASLSKAQAAAVVDAVFSAIINVLTEARPARGNQVPTGALP